LNSEKKKKKYSKLKKIFLIKKKMKKIVKKLFLQKKKRYLKKIVGSFEKPRLSVFRSHKHIYAQLIDDQKGQTLTSSSTLDSFFRLSSQLEKEQNEGRKFELSELSEINKLGEFGDLEKTKKEKSKLSKLEDAFLVGQIIAKKALGQQITTIVFDRGEKPYHGRIKEIANGARQEGLLF
jgi:large subunit ribosomal protein L18